MDDVELLEQVLAKTATVVEGVSPDDWDLPTPCPEFDVRTLLGHLVGWGRFFAAVANGSTYDGDPAAYVPDASVGASFRAAADSMVAGWRRYGVDREVTMSSPLPGSVVLNMTLMEFVTHGWDLATATAQPVPYTAAEAERVLALAESTLPPQYRGEGQAFGAIVPVADDAAAMARLVGFMGRRPAAS